MYYCFTCKREVGMFHETGYPNHYVAEKQLIANQPIKCDKSREPPCHLEPSEELCSKCPLSQNSESYMSSSVTQQGKIGDIQTKRNKSIKEK